jgi:hypothetical protein
MTEVTLPGKTVLSPSRRRTFRAGLPLCPLRDPPPKGGPGAANPERAKDHEFFAEFYPGLKALLAKDIGAPY